MAREPAAFAGDYGSGFIQVVAMVTTRISDIEALVDDWEQRTQERRHPRRSIICRDRDRPDTYLAIVWFPSFEAKEINSALPEEDGFRSELTGLCESEPIFYSYDVLSTGEC
jgi:hypothetical protein